METRLNLVKSILAAAAAGSVLSACGNGAQAPPSTSTVSSVSGTLKFSVGTANIYGAVGEGGLTGLNVATSYRIGKNSVLLSTPKITGPFTLPGIVDSCDPMSPGMIVASCGGLDVFTTGPGAPSVLETSQAVGTIEGTPQSFRPNDPVCDYSANCTPGSNPPNATSFGQSGGVFALGILPSNSTNNGNPYTYQPYVVPFYDQYGLTTEPWGGPPAFDPDKRGDGVRDGYNDVAVGSGVQGVQLGIDVFEGVSTPAGTYNMALQIPTGISSGGVATFQTVNATAAINPGGTTILPDIPTPPMVEDGNGGGNFAAYAPLATAPFYEGLIQITDFGPGGDNDQGTGAVGVVGNCQGPLGPGEAGPVYYTLVYHPGDPVSALTLPALIGPNSLAGQSGFALSPTLCTAAQNTAALGTASPGDNYSVQVIGTDYPLYEASPIFGANAPVLFTSNAGTAGQADISLSIPTEYTYGVGPVLLDEKARFRKSVINHRTNSIIRRHG